MKEHNYGKITFRNMKRKIRRMFIIERWHVEIDLIQSDLYELREIIENTEQVLKNHLEDHKFITDYTKTGESDEVKIPKINARLDELIGRLKSKDFWKNMIEDDPLIFKGILPKPDQPTFLHELKEFSEKYGKILNDERNNMIQEVIEDLNELKRTRKVYMSDTPIDVLGNLMDYKEEKWKKRLKK